jgi:hypothetical protein
VNGEFCGCESALRENAPQQNYKPLEMKDNFLRFDFRRGICAGFAPVLCRIYTLPFKNKHLFTMGYKTAVAGK